MRWSRRRGGGRCREATASTTTRTSWRRYSAGWTGGRWGWQRASAGCGAPYPAGTPSGSASAFATPVAVLAQRRGLWYSPSADTSGSTGPASAPCWHGRWAGGAAPAPLRTGRRPGPRTRPSSPSPSSPSTATSGSAGSAPPSCSSAQLADRPACH